MEQSKLSKFVNTIPQISKFEYYPNLDVQEKEWNIQINHDIDIKYLSADEAVVTLELKIDFKEDNGPFKIDAASSVHFKWKDVSEDVVYSVLTVSAPVLLLSYMRPIISMFTSSSGFMPFHVPLLDFSQENK